MPFSPEASRGRRVPGGPQLSRRAALLTGGGALAAFLAACTANDDGAPGGTDGSPGAAAGTGPTPSGSPAEPDPWTALMAGPTQTHRADAVAAVEAMSTGQRAGQVLVGELDRTGVDDDSIRELGLGGVIVMGEQVPRDDGGQGADDQGAGDQGAGDQGGDEQGAGGTVDLEALTQRVESAAAALAEGRDWSGIVGVDQEGGLVARVTAPLTEWPTPMSYGAVWAADPARGAELAWAGHAAMGRDLAPLGFTVDFAPSIDVTVGPQDPTIGARSFSSDVEAVTLLGPAAVGGLLSSGLLPSPKHFPGHGSVTDDSHETAPVQSAGVAELRERDWRPFAELLSAEAEVYTPMVMMGHIIVPELDETDPSSVSTAAYETLRALAGPGESGVPGAAGDSGAAAGRWDGVVVTDALNMGALVERYGPDEAPVMALAAGADLLLMPSSVPGAHAAIVAAVESGEVSEDRLRQAAERVVTMLLWRDELAALVTERGGDAASGNSTALPSSAEVSTALSAAAVTSLADDCSGAFVDGSLQISGGSEADRSRLAEAARSAGLEVGSGPVVDLIGTVSGSGTGDVVVALDAPYGLAESTVPDAGALLALYGSSPGAFTALVDVLTGQAQAPGALPVEVGDWPLGSGCTTG